MANDGLIVSPAEPVGIVGKFTWIKPVDGVLEFYEKVNGEWSLVHTQTPHCPAQVDNDVNFTGDIYAGGEKGLTGSRTIGGYTITFKNGILTGFTS